MNIRCKLELHKWKYNTEEIKDGTIRTCMRCDKEEIYIVIFNKWYSCLEGNFIIFGDTHYGNSQR